MKQCQRLGQGFIFGVTGLALMISFYLQYIEALTPCPLCLMQRGMMVLIFLVALLGIFLVKRGVLVVEFFVALAGVFFALRQLWLQSLPVADTGVCLPGVEMLIHKLPWHEVLHTFVWGGTSCGEVAWTFAGLSMPAWSLIYFSLIGILSVFLGVKYSRDEHV
ncbi:MAG: disulfide bond formation protein B [Legionella sp.]|nr:disulfide bond formation protein B [Legionella sp.]